MDYIIGWIVIIVGVILAIRGFSKNKDRMEEYRKMIRNMSNEGLRAEQNYLAQRSRALGPVVNRYAQSGIEAYDIKDKYPIVRAELSRRGLS